jgi:hypothetical protein
MHALDRSRDALFVERLHAKTLARGLAWAPSEHEGRFSVALGDWLVEIGEGGPDGGAEILICGKDGQALELLSPGPAETSRQLFAETYEAARRIALGIDGVIETLIESLG